MVQVGSFLLAIIALDSSALMGIGFQTAFLLIASCSAWRIKMDELVVFIYYSHIAFLGVQVD